MKIRVLAFGPLSELGHALPSELELPGGATVAVALDALRAAVPGLEPRLGSLACAVDAAYVRRDRVLAAGETLALIPPVSGG